MIRRPSERPEKRENPGQAGVHEGFCGRGWTQTEHLAEVRAAEFRVESGETRHRSRAGGYR